MTARPLLALAAAVTTGVLLASTAVASPMEARTATVSHADLDLLNATGRAALERRVAAAADKVCAYPGTLDLRTLREANRCRTDAVRDALQKIDLAVAQSTRQLAAAAGSAGGR